MTATATQEAKSASTVRERLRIVTDSREQKPYTFPAGIETIVKALPAGDYSLEGYENRIAIERKSMADWVSTLLTGRDRFAKELTKLQSYDFACIVVEGSIPDLWAGKYRSKIEPSALLGISCSILHKYSPVHLIFAGDRPHAVQLTYQLLKVGAKYLEIGKPMEVE